MRWWYPFVLLVTSNSEVVQIISFHLFVAIVHSFIAFSFLVLSSSLCPQVFTFLRWTFLTVLSIILLVVTCSWFFSFHILIRHQLAIVRVWSSDSQPLPCKPFLFQFIVIILKFSSHFQFIHFINFDLFIITTS